jgi:hypothetical protein
MAREASPQATTLTEATTQRTAANARPPETAALLQKVERVLQAEGPEEALELLARSRDNSPWVTNARGVCLLRLGEAARAVDLFRGLVLGAGGLCLRQDVPTVFQTNFATALLLAGNLSGFLSALADTHDKGHPAVQRLAAAVGKWRAGLSFWEKVRWYLGGEVGRPVTLDCPPGDL